MLSDIDKLDLSTLLSKRPHIPLRRDGDGRLAKEVRDIIALLQYADEHQLIASLPKYVASSPDTMPSIRLYDRDMNVMINLLQNLNAKLVEFGSALAAITSEVHSLQQVRSELSHLRSVVNQTWPVVGDVNTTSVKSVAGNGNYPR